MAIEMRINIPLACFFIREIGFLGLLCERMMTDAFTTLEL
jgi:hypothetical protein